MRTEPLPGSANFLGQDEDNQIPNARQGGIEVYWAGILEQVKKQSEASASEKPPGE